MTEPVSVLSQEQELYKALKSMCESYDLVMSNFPNGIARNSVQGFFVNTIQPAKDAVLRFEVLKTQEIHDGTITFDQSYRLIEP